MKLFEILNEVKVQSSWISDLVYHRTGKFLTFVLNKNRAYIVSGISRRVFDEWKSAPSKGKYWHKNIKGKYNTRRIR